MTSNIISKTTRCHHNPQVSCGDCRLNSICLPISVHVDELDRLDEIIQRGRPLHKGDYLYHANDRLPRYMRYAREPLNRFVLPMTVKNRLPASIYLEKF